MLDLSALDAGASANGPAGVPLLLPIDRVDEDPAQPRREFDAVSLQQLAETIQARGVRQPVSVRPHPQLPGRWLLNFGARRLRAARLAGLLQIPAFIDETADSYDQVIENEQREALKPIELALFIGRELQAGRQRQEIARRLGKSAAYVTFASALIEAPDWLMEIYRAGRCRGLTELYELRRLHASAPQQVEQWARDKQQINRPELVELKAALQAPAPPSGGTTAGTPEDGPVSGAREEAAPPPTANSRRKARQALLAEHNGELVKLLLDVVPPQEGCVYVCVHPRGARRLVALAQLQLRKLVAC